MAETKPAYVVLFSTDDDLDETYEPLILGGDKSERQSIGTVPHGLDHEVIEALPGLWYCLHLPATFFELIDLSASTLKASQQLHHDHHILLAPIQAFDRQRLGPFPPWVTPALVICPDHLADEASRRASAYDVRLSVAMYSELSDESLRRHWRAIHTAFVPDAVYLGREPTLTTRLDLAPVDLPALRLARQLDAIRAERDDGSDLSEKVQEALMQQLVLAAIARMERANLTRAEAEKAFPEAMDVERTRLQIPNTLVMPGVANAYTRRLPQDGAASVSAESTSDRFWAQEVFQPADAPAELATMSFLATHRALARGGLGMVTPTLPPEAFHQLAELELHCRIKPNGRKVWTMLDRLDAAVAPIWSDALTDLVRSASMLTTFTNFPIGLLRLPGDSAPMAARVPIAYRPLTPLTRTLQHELFERPAVHLHEGFRVLVAECIPDHDPVGLLSRAGWRIAGQMFHDLPGTNSSLHLAETLTIDALRRAVAEHIPDVLVISAHGVYDATANLAGLMIGNEPSLGGDLGPMPPLVVLSACTVAPRGAGAVSVADLLLREGALAVMGTQIPVRVDRNATLVGRLFVYMLLVTAGREPQRNLLEIWHRVQSSNAINDVLSGHPALHLWGGSPGPGGKPVLIEFMNDRSLGRIRTSDVYQDTEQVLGEMAGELGIGDKFRAWVRNPGYVPESLFYVLIGRPERINFVSPLALVDQGPDADDP